MIYKQLEETLKWDRGVEARGCRIDYCYIKKESDKILVGTKWGTSGASFFPDGRVELDAYLYPHVLKTINMILPHGLKIYRFSHRILLIGKSFEKSQQLLLPNTINKNGKLVRLGDKFKVVKNNWYKAQRARINMRARGLYWRKKASGIKLTRHSGCTRWHGVVTAPQSLACGCLATSVPIRFDETVAMVLAEKNATVRTAKIKCYGIEKFFKDAKAKTICKQDEYELLTLDTGSATDRRRWETAESETNVTLTALKMTCPSTGQTYINTVPGDGPAGPIDTVGKALSWMYNVEDYEQIVGKQT